MSTKSHYIPQTTRHLSHGTIILFLQNDPSSYDNTIRLWDTQTNQCVDQLALNPNDNIWSVAFNFDGSVIAAST